MNTSAQKPCFTEHIHGTPIAGTPAPLECPFCADPGRMSMAGPEDAGGAYQAICSKCGAWGPPGETQLEAGPAMEPACGRERA